MNKDMNILDKAIEILKKYPLCDRCLGRLFGYLGKELSNLDRGKALKLLIVLDLHRRLQENEIDLDTARNIILNTQKADVLKNLNLGSHEDGLRYCYICGNKIEEWINTFSEKIASAIVSLNVPSFIVGVSSIDEASDRESEIAKEFDLKYWEHIKRELKREIGKKVRSLVGTRIDFEDPGATFIVNIESGSVEISYSSLLVYGRYWKFGRMISQNRWIDRGEGRKYDLSIEDVVIYTKNILRANDYAIHIAGREDVDVRTLGSGRPIVIEFKTINRDVSIEEVERILNSYTPWLSFRLMMRVNREFVSRMKSSAKSSRKIYRAIVYTEIPTSEENMRFLDSFFKDRVIEQRTPTRVLRRRKDVVRRRKVYRVKSVHLAPHLFEALIECDGGLYVKELVTGDNGRSTPSFSEVLGCRTECVMLDVLYVHEYI
ncbi:MAG: tRNA pseudouridine(54/55) synthase Pus10 [Ignisphaera sp.]|uniref:tRNA pseudouridine(55) synthase n=2 Tax=Ignisphaera aggregans TaxID=334771 RepID=A0A832AQR5_9CREN